MTRIPGEDGWYLRMFLGVLAAGAAVPFLMGDFQDVRQDPEPVASVEHEPSYRLPLSAYVPVRHEVPTVDTPEVPAAILDDPGPPARAWSVDWDRLAECESHGEWDYGPHSNWGSRRFHGGLQYHPGTWSAFKPAGYPDYAYQATREQQIVVAEKVLAAQGLKAWPACTKALGWR